MAIRYNSQTRIGDLDIVDNEGRGHRVRFGGAGNGQNVKTDINFEFDPTCPDQLGFLCDKAPQGQIDVQLDKVVFSNNAIDVEIYTRLGDTLRPSDFQFDALLKTRAAANAAASFTLQLTGYQNFDFIYITPFVPVYEEIKRGQPWVYNYDRAQYLIDPSSVPEPPGGYLGRQKWHNGGYHVKHKTWKNQRQNSTYCHICVPRLTDPLGNEAWGTIDINPLTGIVTYSNDATFLATRTLPIRLDPTFGDTTAGTDTFPMNSDRILAGIFSNPDSGVTLTKLTAYVDNSTALDNKGVFFAVSGGVPTGDPLGVGAATAVPGAPAWTDFDMNDEALSVTDYALGLVAPNFTGDWYKDASGGNDSHMDNGNSYATPNSWSETASYGGQMNIYATTASGGGTTDDTFSMAATGSATFAAASASKQNLSVIASAVLTAASKATVSRELSVISAAAFTGASNSKQSEYLSVSAISSLTASAIALTAASLSITSTSSVTFGAASSADVPVTITSAASATFASQSSASADLQVTSTGLFSPVGSTQSAGSADFTMAATAAFTADAQSASAQDLGITTTATFTAEAAAASVVNAAMEIAATSSLIMNVAEESSSLYRDGWDVARRRKAQMEKERRAKQEAEIFTIIQAALPQILGQYLH